MKEIIGILFIMLFCIVALSREKQADSIVLLSRPRTKMVMLASSHFKQVPESAVTAPVNLATTKIFAGRNRAGLKYGHLSKIQGRFGFISGDGLNARGSAKSRNIRFITRRVGMSNGCGRVQVCLSAHNSGNQLVANEGFGAIYGSVTWRAVAPCLGVSGFTGFLNQRFKIHPEAGDHAGHQPRLFYLPAQNIGAHQFNIHMQGYHWRPVA